MSQLPMTPGRMAAVDESPTKDARANSWPWTFVAGQYTFFALRNTRAATVLDELLTDNFNGVVNCECRGDLLGEVDACIHLPDGQQSGVAGKLGAGAFDFEASGGQL